MYVSELQSVEFGTKENLAVLFLTPAVLLINICEMLIDAVMKPLTGGCFKAVVKNKTQRVIFRIFVLGITIKTPFVSYVTPAFYCFYGNSLVFSIIVTE